jgi:hypothetical protein
MASSYIADAIRAGAPRFAGATDATVVPCQSLCGPLDLKAGQRT